ncbi:thiol-disulfide oxidoreductase DCC family protein [Pseudoalteromonas sp. 2CM28B]|uniref:thiol-disulfide oxidoreductase DCC family protein n=1 Tax=Pseudoalteromonas sp. 2CM28B TaxID=2929851 RepID=UPI0020C02118|nr:DCC1-like thiol-disulfide oxidoreductase family protein [Pseudoalteromonas sp. 2CM28B]MCK8135968.1 DCC1-like thiol-disulfide oxidoreductase family protein [Pseudoalteromonas sp. 2CM28B]MDC9522185.1 DCC1-like thiol-disulfide oxidoreductase family protein [Pseudoalteromonas sp. Angola-31]
MSDDAATLMRNQKIILFDAQCKLCSAWCNFIISIFKLCSVQSPKGALLLTHFGFSTTQYASMVYLQNGKAYTQSHAFFEVVKQLGYPYKLATVFSVLPSTFNNWLYDKIALNRYTLFGKYQYCRIPNPEDAKHYL